MIAFVIFTSGILVGVVIPGIGTHLLRRPLEVPPLRELLLGLGFGLGGAIYLMVFNG